MNDKAMNGDWEHPRKAVVQVHCFVEKAIVNLEINKILFDQL